MAEQIIDPKLKPVLQAELERRDREARRTPRQRSDAELREEWLAMTPAAQRHIHRQAHPRERPAGESAGDAAEGAAPETNHAGAGEAAPQDSEATPPAES